MGLVIVDGWRKGDAVFGRGDGGRRRLVGVGETGVGDKLFWVTWSASGVGGSAGGVGGSAGGVGGSASGVGGVAREGASRTAVRPEWTAATGDWFGLSSSENATP